jgi:hypothetical protein
MPRKHLPFAVVGLVVFAITSARASSINPLPQKFASSSTPYVLPTIVPGVAATLFFPSSPDNWLGGTGNWSNGVDWSSGLPGSNNDVSINTGSDNVTLDTSSSINSLALGGSTGNSQLTGDGNAHTVTIAGALTVNQSGNLSLFADTVTAGANSTNLGIIDLENASSLQVNGNFNTSGSFCAGCNSNIGTLTVTGTLTNTGGMQFGNCYYMLCGGGSATVGGLANTGSIALPGSSGIEVIGNATNSGEIFFAGGSLLGVGGNLINSGSLAISSNDPGCCNYISVAGTLTNTSTGSIMVTAQTQLSLGALVNQGLVSLRGNDYTEVNLTITGDVSNSGTIALGPSEPSGGLEQISVGGTLTNSPGAQFNLNTTGDHASVGNLINGGSVGLLGYLDTMSVGSIVNTGTIDVADFSTLQVTGDVTNSGAITTSLLSQGGATLTVGGTLTNNLGGSLVLYGLGDTATVASLINNGTVDLENRSSLHVNGNVSNSGQLTTSYYGNGYGVGNTVSIAGALTNSVSGTFALDATSDVANVGYISNTGMVSLASGTNLNVTGGPHAGDNALPGFLNNGVVDISSGATLFSPLTYTQTGGQTTVDGTVRISGRGIINFAGGSVYGNEGTIQGSITSNAAINIGDGPMVVGELAFVGNYTQGNNGSLTFDIAGPSSDQYDQLNVSGHAQLNGLMTVDLLHGYVPQIGNTFDIMNFGSSSGNFSMVLGLPINGQEHFALQYNPTSLMLDVVQGQLSGPPAGNGASFSSEPFITTGSDESGFSLTASNNGTPSPTPEPCTLLLLGSGMVGLVGLMRRSRSG